ncbi:MAG: Purine nucleoside phosphorylase [uncultured Solirubrobacterales bacterium]|uniref:Uridine phosphorylase n=1 Tax=uncultured Solirubrobacterales bacterium TaxID=768556 RepID=A0A6J4RZD0_9ACTN|nr:MAG: Purine nucleoside phosphorylase [uncultured Solirubrobacterales bacterium]
MSHIVRVVPRTPERTPVHLKPAAPLAERVLLPGDPHRALQVAQHLLERPRMLNHHRGLWGYTGQASDGLPLSVQATGMGGPTTAIVVEELIALGARSFVRIGTCGALDPSLALGDLIVAREALAADGTSAALGAVDRVRGDEGLSDSLARAAGAPAATVASADLFYDDRAGVAAGWRARGAIAVEMEAATLLRLAELRGVRAGCLLAVTDLLDPGSHERAARHMERLDREKIEAVGLRLGEAALAALAD